MIGFIRTLIGVLSLGFLGAVIGLVYAIVANEVGAPMFATFAGSIAILGPVILLLLFTLRQGSRRKS